MTTSIIIPTYKRKKSLIRLLDSLVAELNKNVEIIICEQKYNNKNLIKAYAEKKKVKIIYLFKKNLGTSAAKNFAVQSSEGKYLIFLDDDVVVHPGLVNNLTRALKKKKVGAVCGRVITPGQTVEEYNKKVGKISYMGKFSNGFSSLIPQDIDTVIGCNCAWRRDIFLKIGGYDEQFTGAIREDSDISVRTKEYGLRIVFVPSALVYHLREPTGGGRKSEGRLNWYFNFFSNETYFFLKYRRLFIVPVILLTRADWILKCMFGFGREVSVRSVSTPLLGIISGVKKYINYEHRNRRRVLRG